MTVSPGSGTVVVDKQTHTHTHPHTKVMIHDDDLPRDFPMDGSPLPTVADPMEKVAPEPNNVMVRIVVVWYCMMDLVDVCTKYLVYENDTR